MLKRIKWKQKLQLNWCYHFWLKILSSSVCFLLLSCFHHGPSSLLCKHKLSFSVKSLMTAPRSLRTTPLSVTRSPFVTQQWAPVMLYHACINPVFFLAFKSLLARNPCVRYIHLWDVGIWAQFLDQRKGLMCWWWYCIWCLDFF